MTKISTNRAKTWYELKKCIQIYTNALNTIEGGKSKWNTNKKTTTIMSDA